MRISIGRREGNGFWDLTIAVSLRQNQIIIIIIIIITIYEDVMLFYFFQNLNGKIKLDKLENKNSYLLLLISRNN